MEWNIIPRLEYGMRVRIVEVHHQIWLWLYFSSWYLASASGKRDVTFRPCDKAPQGTTRQKRRERHYVNMAGCLLGKRHEYMTSKRQKSSKKGRKGRKYYNRNVRKYTVKKQKQYMNLYPFYSLITLSRTLKIKNITTYVVQDWPVATFITRLEVVDSFGCAFQ